MNSSDDVHRMTETIYRSLSEQFNPAVRQILTCAKAYHKALMGASTAARSYIESLGRLGHNCRTSCQGGTEEIGEAIFRIAEIQKEVQLKFEDSNKALFAEIIIPLEHKLDSDFKNAVAEQKKYHGGHKSFCVPYSKAVEAHKKFLKKNNRSRLAFDDEKEKPLQRTVEKCKDKLDEFRLQGLKLALLEERRCYCFILARLSSVSSTHLYYHDRGMDLLTVELGHWKQLCSQPNILPRSADPLLRIVDNNTNSYAVYRPDGSQSPYRHISRTPSDAQHSEYALPASTSTSSDTIPRSVANIMSQPPLGPPPGPPGALQVRALYSHTGGHENQLTFSVGDSIAVMGDAADGWQFGHNSRTGQYGWFPLSFTDSPEARQQSQTQTPLRYRQRAKSFSELNGDARSLSDFSGWSPDHYTAGTHHRPRSLHESSLVNAPSLPQLLGQMGDGLDFSALNALIAATPTSATYTMGTRSMPASRAPSRAPSPPLPPPPPQLSMHAGGHGAPPALPSTLPPALSRHLSMRSLHHADTLPVGIHLQPLNHSYHVSMGTGTAPVQAPPSMGGPGSAHIHAPPPPSHPPPTAPVLSVDVQVGSLPSSPHHALLQDHHHHHQSSPRVGRMAAAASSPQVNMDPPGHATGHYHHASRDRHPLPLRHHYLLPLVQMECSPT